MVLAWVAAGCSSSQSPPQGSPTPGSDAVVETGGSGGSSTPGTGEAGSGGSGGAPGAPQVDSGGPLGSPDASSGATLDAGPMVTDSATPMGSDGGPQPSYEGEVPIYYGPDPGPIVKMNCPEDPAQGWTEYQDSFHVERPYDVPINTRFSIINGVYSFWVFPNDKPHSTDAMGRNPRTEATYGGTHDKANVRGGTGLYSTTGFFTTGKRMYSADMLIERNALGSAIMQIHTTTAGGGPVAIRDNGGNLDHNGRNVGNASAAAGGLVDNWFNYKVALDTATLEVQIYINNCLTSTYKGDRGDGNFYFKNGVYFCKKGPVCRSHYKNIHLYSK
jgi:hypothetical protein